METFPTRSMRRTCARVSFGVLSLQIFLGSLLAASPVFTTAAYAASLTAATGGSSIPSSTVGGSWTTLTGPVITNIDENDMSPETGTIVLTAPAGFEFDTGGTAPTVRVNCTASCGAPNTNADNINGLASNATIAVVMTSSTATVTITDDVDGNSALRNSLTWQNLRVRPTAVVPLASGNITRSGISFSGVSNSSSFGTLTETGPTCDGQNGTIVVVNGTIYGGPMNGLPYNDILIGTSGNDVIVTGNGNAYVDGLGGNDTICGGNGSDILNGGSGNDTIFGGNGQDAITGGPGNDDLRGGNANDVLFGGSGTDDCEGDSGDDHVGGCGGDDHGEEVGSITVTKDAQPDDAQDFAFTGSWNFTLDDDAQATLPSSWTVAANDTSTRTITEALVSGWTLSALSCTGGGADTSVNLATRTATINIDDDEEVLCTFTNTKHGTLHVIKNAVGGDGTFNFTNAAVFSILTTGGVGTYDISLVPGTYSVDETPVAGWGIP